MKEEFIGEPMLPDKQSLSGEQATPGEPFFPAAFTWRGGTVHVAAIVSKWKESSPCRHGSGERYLRRHWYEVRTEDGQLMKIYFDRQGRGKQRWHIYSRWGES